ncbi:MAG TPA: hypothetical protein VEP69_02120 [Thermodesulfovibrionales bacterium]|nr:hypothetical protein [Thermodesulfovibrionales bacterium]
MQHIPADINVYPVVQMDVDMEVLGSVAERFAHQDEFVLMGYQGKNLKPP